MTATWHDANNAYLATALDRLRSRLRRVADGRSEPPDDAPAPGPCAPLFLQDIEDASGDALEPAPDPESKVLAAMEVLAARLGLSQFEADVLLLSAAAEFDTRIPHLCAAAHDDTAKPFPTFALAFTALDGPSWDALSPHRPLRARRLIEVHQSPAQPLLTSPLRADERVVHFLKGLNEPDDRLAAAVRPLEHTAAAALADSQRQVVASVLRALAAEPGMDVSSARPPVIQLLGRDEAGKRVVAGAVAASLGLLPYRLDPADLGGDLGELRELVRLWDRECLLLPLCLYVEGTDEAGREPADRDRLLRQLLARVEGLVFLDAREPVPLGSRPSLNVAVEKPTRGEQLAAWTDRLGSRHDALARRLAGQFNLPLADVGRLGDVIDADDADGDDAGRLEDRLWRACVAASRPRLDALAHRVDVKAAWDDLIVPMEQEAALRAVVGQVRERVTVWHDWGFDARSNRGLGVTALFAGESGTGKTMAAEVVAHELGLDLYRVDLSSVVDKYVGETEKNLRRLFDAADDGGVVLFFDEADALFGKRTQVKDSHDRFANIEVDYLLQRMEEYRGLAVLATNDRAALDAAFLRRLRFVVDFPFPSVADRKRIWQRVFPPQTPLAPLDHDHLAALRLSGGGIYSVALNAAFTAAAAKNPVDMPTILGAARTEYRKLRQPIDAAHFEWPLAPPSHPAARRAPAHAASANGGRR